MKCNTLREANSRGRGCSDDLCLMIIGSPFAGRNVTCKVGHTACPGLS